MKTMFILALSLFGLQLLSNVDCKYNDNPSIDCPCRGDRRAPLIVEVSPSSSSLRDLSSSFSITFNEPMRPATIIANNIFLQDDQGNIISGALTYDVATFRASFSPSQELLPNTNYILVIKGGRRGVKDRAGNPLRQTAEYRFLTESILDIIKR